MFKGKGLQPGAFQLWVRGSQRAPPHPARKSALFAASLSMAAQRTSGARTAPPGVCSVAYTRRRRIGLSLAGVQIGYTDHTTPGCLLSFGVQTHNNDAVKSGIQPYRSSVKPRRWHTWWMASCHGLGFFSPGNSGKVCSAMVRFSHRSGYACL
jgi:hypothetical protein